MSRKPLFLTLIIILLTTLGCSFTVNVPTIKTVPEQTFTISEPAPGDNLPTDVMLRIGAADLNITGGGAGLLEGSVVYNLADWEPEITRGDHKLKITQGNAKDVGGINIKDVKNVWNLRFSDNAPLRLSLDAGAYTGVMDFSNIPLQSLEIRDGASDNTLRFDTPNPSILETFDYLTGASTVRLLSLGNANCSELTFKGGAGSYTLDFTGALNHDMNVQVDAGVSTIRLIVPSNVRVEVQVAGEMKSVSPQGTWTVNDNLYSAGTEGPLLKLQVNTTLGTLVLEQAP